MPCFHGTDGRGASFVVCGRGRRRRCGEPGCREWSTKVCDFALTGTRAGKTCDRPLCDRHARCLKQITRIDSGLRTADTVDYCPTHFLLVDASAAPAANDDEQPRQLTLGERPAPPPPRAPPPPPPRTAAELGAELLANLDKIT